MGKSDKSKNAKNSQLIVRINKDERDRFVDICNDIDTSAAREVRHFIRDFIAKHETAKHDK